MNENPSEDNIDLIIILSHELAVALELSYDTVELKELWGEAVEGLRRTRRQLLDRGMPVPAAVENVIRKADL